MFMLPDMGESLYSTFLKRRKAIPCFSVFPSLNMVLTLVMFLLQNSSLRLLPLLLMLSDREPNSPKRTISPLHRASVTMSSRFISTDTMSAFPTLPLRSILLISSSLSRTPQVSCLSVGILAEFCQFLNYGFY